MSTEFGKKDCVHFEEEDATCKINKGCGSGSVYCRPMWTDTKCYTQEKPDSIPDDLAHQIYAYGDTLVTRQKDGKCWQLNSGNYLGELSKDELIFVKKAILSD